MSEWKHKDVWKKQERTFCIEVVRWSFPNLEYRDGETTENGIKNIWNVYAYIYPEHPHFKKFEGQDMWQDAASCLPLHGGPTFLEYIRDKDSVVCSVKVGCDYAHLCDDRFERMGTKESAYEVFSDADELFNMLATWEAVKAETA